MGVVKNNYQAVEGHRDPIEWIIVTITVQEGVPVEDAEVAIRQSIVLRTVTPRERKARQFAAAATALLVSQMTVPSATRFLRRPSNSP